MRFVGWICTRVLDGIGFAAQLIVVRASSWAPFQTSSPMSLNGRGVEHEDEAVGVDVLPRRNVQRHAAGRIALDAAEGQVPADPKGPVAGVAGIADGEVRGHPLAPGRQCDRDRCLCRAEESIHLDL
jgi:hypothetical protein